MLIPPRASFVIPVLNDAARLRRCLASIARLDYPRELVEVVVIDNGSRDGSDRVAEEAGATVVRAPGLRVGELRNLGVRHARSDVLAFVDADHEIDKGWLRAAVENLQDPQVAAVGALCRAPADGTWVQRMYDALRGRATGRHRTEWLGSGNMALRRSAFERAGGFQSTLSTCEDVDLCRRLRAGGLLVISDHALGSVHLGDPATLRALFVSELWRGRDNLRASLRGSWSLRALPSIAIPIVQLAALALAAAGLATAAVGGLRVVLAATGAICGLAALRTGRMIANGGLATPMDGCRAFAVACTYDMARALALVAKVGHRGRSAATP